MLVDAERKRLLLKTTVVQREAMLEMFLCKVGTKEHETVVSIDSDAYVIHAGLLAIGAKPGDPVEFTPNYKPPTGQIIDIFVNWTDEDGSPASREGSEMDSRGHPAVLCRSAQVACRKDSRCRRRPN